MNRAGRNVARPAEEIAEAPLPDLSLPEVLNEAVTWQAEAEAVIALCLPAGGKTQDLARRTGAVATVYRRLREANGRLPRTPAQQEVDRLLNFHEQIVEQALLLGFRPDSPARENIAAHFVGGLADPGQRLRHLRDEVRAPG
jgi:hypothetical protein